MVSTDAPARFSDRTRPNEALLKEAATTALGNETGLVILAVIDRADFETVHVRLEVIGDVEHTHYGEQTVLNTERDALKDTVNALIDSGLMIDCHVSVAPESEHVETILNVSDQFGCDHLFITGPRRSPTGKAIFGDVAQQLLLQYPGFVTVKLG